MHSACQVQDVAKRPVAASQIGSSRRLTGEWTGVTASGSNQQTWFIITAKDTVTAVGTETKTVIPS
jgi:hypothetical protein